MTWPHTPALAARLHGMPRPPIMDRRAEYSRMRLEELAHRLNSIPAEHTPEDLAVFCAGSYARQEASEYSDIDLFFIYGTQNVERQDKRLREIRLFASTIDAAQAMGFPEFSNDAQYLETIHCSDVLRHLGAREDDGLNHFTMRMLMLLESKCLVGAATFEQVQREIIAAYYRDYPDHQSSFEPWFLINDIGRFWKTLLLNYENKRNQDSADPVQKNKQKVRNFKLKYSRMTTCFATIAALASHQETIGEDHVLELVQLTPQGRLERVADRMPAVAAEVQSIQAEYAWFMQQTGKPEEELRAGFEDRVHREERFQRANSYGDKMFALLVAIAKHSPREQSDKFLRYLVI
jgi:predicted nucleotidyltransferase